MTATRWKASLAAAAALVCAAGTARADERDDRIRELERRLAEQAADQAAMRREMQELRAGGLAAPDRDALHGAVDEYLRATGGGPSGYYIGPGNVRRPGGNIVLGGYFSTLYRSSEEDGAHGSFVDMRLVPQIHADISDFIDFDAEIEFEHAGVGGPADGEIVIEYAELSFSCSEAFSFKAGTLLIPFGKFNLQHDDPINELSSRPSVARYVVPSAFALPGIGADGVLEVSDDMSFNYDVVLVNGFDDEFDSENGSRGARGLFEDDDNHGKTVFTRLGLVPTLPWIDAVDLGVSGVYGHAGEGEGRDSHRVRGYGFDVAAIEGPWEFLGEWNRLSIDRRGDVLPPIDPSGMLGPVRGMDGYYAQLLYRFRDGWVRSLPFAEESASFAVVLRRDFIDLNDRVNGASKRDDERAWTVGVNYRPTTKTVVKIEYRKARSGAPGEDRDLFVVEFATYF